MVSFFKHNAEIDLTEKLNSSSCIMVILEKDFVNQMFVIISECNV